MFLSLMLPKVTGFGENIIFEYPVAIMTRLM